MFHIGTGHKSGQIWIEVYLVPEKKWVVVDGTASVVSLGDIEKKLTQPITYIVCYDGGKCEFTLLELTNRIWATRNYMALIIVLLACAQNMHRPDNTAVTLVTR